jgi:hypothetical protein
MDQAMLPPDTLKQLLHMQQNQFKTPVDPILTNSDHALFGFKSIHDWFGPQFLSLISQFIVNAAQIAEQRGYEVTTEEIRADLFQNIFRAHQQLYRNEELSAEDADRYYQMKMRSLGMDETMLISGWRKVMLFRRLFTDGSGSVLVDPLVYRHFDQFAKESAEVVLYQLPSSLQFADFRSMIQFQLYLESIAADPSRLRTDLKMPTQIASFEQIEKRAPEIVERKIEVEYRSISKDDLSRAISVKETWEWEAADPHWDQLKKQFSELASAKSDSKQGRLEILNGLEAEVRERLDQFARTKMLEEQPEKIASALDTAPVQTETVSLRARGGSLPFPGLTASAELIALLDRAAIKGETPNEANERLNLYSADGKNLYHIEILSRDPTKKVLTYIEASLDGTLERMFDKKLEDAYPDLRKKDFHAFQSPRGGWKPFKEVKDAIAKLYFSDLLNAIEEHYKAHYTVLPGQEGKLPLSFYSNARMLGWMDAARKGLLTHPENSAWVRGPEMTSDLQSQWMLEKTEKKVERSSKVAFAKDEMFRLAPQEWSAVKVGERGAVSFFYVKEKAKNGALPLESVDVGHQILSFDAKRDMMGQLLQKIREKGAISFSSAKEE